MRAARTVRAGMVALASGALVLGTAIPALADDVSASSAGFTDGTNTIYLTLGDSASVTLTYVVTGSGRTPADGKAGCNLVGKDSQLVLDVATSEGSGVTDIPTDQPLVYSACPSEEDPATITLDFNATKVGTETYDFEVDPGTVAKGTFETSGARFTVVVSGPDGRAAPAIANDWMHNRATPTELTACRSALGTNDNLSNWQGNLVMQIAQRFPDQTFTPEQEYIVVAAVESLCGLTTG